MGEVNANPTTYALSVKNNSLRTHLHTCYVSLIWVIKQSGSGRGKEPCPAPQKKETEGPVAFPLKLQNKLKKVNLPLFIFTLFSRKLH